MASKRFEMRAPSDFLDAVQQLADESGVSKADVMRRAVALYAKALTEADNGRVLQFVPEAEARQTRTELLMGAGV